MTNPSPSHEQIAYLAYSYYVDEGCPDGRAEEHWQRAEAAMQGDVTDDPENSGHQ